MTAPRKPVAWIREGAETVMHNVRLDEPSSGPWIALAPIADLQPLWALVEKFEREAGENEINALEADSLGLNEAAKSSDKRAKLLEAIASELRATLEAMQ